MKINIINIEKLGKITFILFTISLFLLSTLFSNYTSRNELDQDISFTRYEHNCSTTLKSVQNEIVHQNIQKNLNISSYELNIFKDPLQIRCLGKVMSIELEEDNIFIGVGTTPSFFLFLTFLYVYFLFTDKKLALKIAYIINILLIKYFFRQDATIFEYIREIIPIVVLVILLKMLDNQKIENVVDKQNYLSKLDSFRAIAVMFVIFNHINKDLLPNGYLGVDIFFVISGYVITKSLLKVEKNNFKIFFKTFVFKRFKRIFPVLGFVVIIFLVSINFYDLNVLNTFFTGVTALFAISNIYLFRESNEYFSDISSYNSFLHTWSLGVEEQFYILFPVIFYVFYKRNSHLKYALTVLTTISLLLFVFEYDNNFSKAYYLIQYRFWEISIGSLLVFLPKYKNSLVQTLNLLGLILIVTINFPNSAYLHLSVVISTCLFILLYDSESLFRKFFKNSIVIKIGLLSYSLYLWHLPINTFFKWESIDLNIFNYLSIILLLSFFSYKYIEFPNRKNFKITRNKIFFLIFSFFTIFTLNPLEAKEFNSVNLRNENISATFRQVECHAPKYIENLSECLESDEYINKNLFLIGDSHISNHFFPIKNVVNDDIYNTQLYVDFGYINYLMTGNIDCENLSCLENGTYEINRFLTNNLDDNDLLIFSVARDRYVQGSEMPREKITEKVEFLNMAIEDLILEIVIPNNSKLFLIDDVPKPCLDSGINWYRDVIQFGSKDVCKIDQSISKADRSVITNLYTNFEKKYKGNVFYFDPHDYLCFDEVCNIIHEDLLLYADLSPHLTYDANEYLEEFWKTILTE